MLKTMIKTVPHTAETENEEATWMKDVFGSRSLAFGRLDRFADHLLTLCQSGRATSTNSNQASRLGNTPSPEIILSDEKDLDLFYENSAVGKGDTSESAGGLNVTLYGARHEALSYLTPATSAHRMRSIASFFL